MNTIELTKVAPLIGLTSTLTTTIATILQDVGNLPEQMMTELAKNGVECTGPMVFEYKGVVDGDVHAKIQLKVICPVAKADSFLSKFTWEEIPGIKALEEKYVGDMMSIGEKGYGKMMADAAQAQIEFTDSCREVYLNWVSPESTENEILIQMEVQS